MSCCEKTAPAPPGRWRTEGGAWPGRESARPRVNSSSIIVSHILITFCASHLVITCAPSLGVVPRSALIPMCLETSLKNNTRLSSVLRALLWILCHQSFSLPPVSCECWSSILRAAHDNRVFVITWFLILSRKGMFIPFKEAISNIPKSPCSPPKWPSLARMVRYGGRVIGACDHVTRVVRPAQTRNLKEITRLMTSPGIPHWAQHAIWEPVPPRPRQQLTPSDREYLR